MSAVEEKVERLESLLGQFIVNTDVALTRLERNISKLEGNISKLEKNISKLEEQTKETDEKLRDFITEMRADRKMMNKQWAALAQKMGTLDEDLVAPAARPVLDKYFDCEPTMRTIRALKRLNGEDFEVDVLAVCSDKVFMIEVRSTPKVDYVNEILDKAESFRKFFPEYGDKELIPIFASIVFPENVVKHATRKKLYIMAYREWEYMDILNFDEMGKN